MNKHSRWAKLSVDSWNVIYRKPDDVGTWMMKIFMIVMITIMETHDQREQDKPVVSKHVL